MGRFRSWIDRMLGNELCCTLMLHRSIERQKFLMSPASHSCTYKTSLYEWMPYKFFPGHVMYDLDLGMFAKMQAYLLFIYCINFNRLTTLSNYVSLMIKSLLKSFSMPFNIEESICGLLCFIALKKASSACKGHCRRDL